MKTILVFLPLVLLTVGFLLGVARFYRALIFFVCWIGLCVLLYIASLMYGFTHLNDPMTPLLGMVVAVLLALPSLWFATLFSIATSPQVSPAPVQQAYDAYQALDDSQKEEVQRLAKTGLGFAARHGSAYLRHKGYHTAASALSEAGKFVNG